MTSSPICSDCNKKTYPRLCLGFMVLAVLLLCLLAANLCLGSVEIPVSGVWQILLHPGSEAGGTADTYAAIVWRIRFPRTLAAAVLGGGLALSGYLLQTFFRNPIAGPFVLGISSGAKLTVALTLVFLLRAGHRSSSFLMIGAAFLGALASMGVVVLFSGRIHSSSMLIVSGVMIGYVCSAVTDFVVTFAEDSDIVNLHNWSMGSFSGITWNNVAVLSVITFAAAAAVFGLGKPLAACRLGENYAVSMGVNIRLLRVALVILSSLLAACVTAFAGPISFVGIAVPQLMRFGFRTSKPIVLIPACFLGGAVFCLMSDLIARTLFAPVELSVSSVTALFGAPVVIWVMIKRKRGEDV